MKKEIWYSVLREPIIENKFLLKLKKISSDDKFKIVKLLDYDIKDEEASIFDIEDSNIFIKEEYVNGLITRDIKFLDEEIFDYIDSDLESTKLYFLLY